MACISSQGKLCVMYVFRRKMTGEYRTSHLYAKLGSSALRHSNFTAEAQSEKWRAKNEKCVAYMTNRKGFLCNDSGIQYVLYWVARWYISWITLCMQCNPLNICAHSWFAVKVSGGRFLQSHGYVALISSTWIRIVWNKKTKAALEPNLLKQKLYQTDPKLLESNI